MATKTDKIKKYKSKFKFNEKNLDYLIQLKKKNRKRLWFLLLLLPLLLLVKCSKDVIVQTLDEDGNVCPHAKVSLAYTARFLYDNKSFFADEPYYAIQTTDTNGITTFKNLIYSVFSSIFYINSKAFISARSECFAKDTTLLFHFICSKKTVQIKMNTIRTDVQLKVIDAKLKSPLENATVYYEYTEKDKVHKDSLSSDANGYVIIPNIRKCHVLELFHTSKLDYEDDVRKYLQVNKLLQNEDNSTIRLNPIDKCIGTWIVKLNGSEKAEYECILGKNNKAKVRYLTPSIFESWYQCSGDHCIFNETYQCDGNNLKISWRARFVRGCTLHLTGTIKDGIYSGTYKHIDVNNGGSCYDKGTFTGRSKEH